MQGFLSGADLTRGWGKALALTAVVVVALMSASAMIGYRKGWRDRDQAPILLPDSERGSWTLNQIASGDSGCATVHGEVYCWGNKRLYRYGPTAARREWPTVPWAVMR